MIHTTRHCLFLVLAVALYAQLCTRQVVLVDRNQPMLSHLSAVARFRGIHESPLRLDSGQFLINLQRFGGGDFQVLRTPTWHLWTTD